MTLGSLRDYVFSIMDHDPEVVAYDDEVDQMINQAYFNLYTRRNWTFAQRVVEIDLLADITVSDITAVEGNSTLNMPSAPSQSGLKGKTIQIDGVEYEVRDVDTVGNQIHLDRGFESADGGYTGTIIHRDIDMPEDCTELLQVERRDPTDNSSDDGPYLPITQQEDVDSRLDLTRTGRPSMWLPVPPFFMRAPRKAPTLNDDGAGSTSVPVAGDYKAVYTFVFGQKESAPSPVATVEGIDSGDEIRLSGMQDTGASSGYEKRVYVRTPEGNGYYVHDGVDFGESTTDMATPIDIPATYLFSSARAPEHDGIYQRIRLYPRQDSDMTIRVHYIARPSRLIEDTDSPQFPATHHKWIAFEVLQELFLKHNNLSQSRIYESRAEREFSKMAQNYLVNSTRDWVKGSFEHGFGRTQTSRFYPRGPVTKLS